MSIYVIVSCSHVTNFVAVGLY